MPDIRNAMRNAGLGGGGPERRCEKCGKMFIPKDTRHRHCDDCFAKVRDHQRGSNAARRRLDFLLGHPDYPAYFDNDGILKCEYLTDLAENWAKVFGERRLTTHQLRAFYGHAKRQQAALEAGRSFREIYPEICKLKAFAAERADKEKIPAEFKEFICRNVDKATDQKAFLSGFMEHFQAIVAYCAGTLKY